MRLGGPAAAAAAAPPMGARRRARTLLPLLVLALLAPPWPSADAQVAMTPQQLAAPAQAQAQQQLAQQQQQQQQQQQPAKLVLAQPDYTIYHRKCARARGRRAWGALAGVGRGGPYSGAGRHAAWKRRRLAVRPRGRRAGGARAARRAVRAPRADLLAAVAGVVAASPKTMRSETLSAADGDYSADMVVRTALWEEGGKRGVSRGGAGSETRRRWRAGAACLRCAPRRPRAARRRARAGRPGE
jgi:hypothetical protein